MDDDDDFGNLYTDFGSDAATTAAGNAPHHGALHTSDDEDEDVLLYGLPSSGTRPSEAEAQAQPLSKPVEGEGEEVQDIFGASQKEVENEEILLYGQLYGDSAQDSKAASGAMNHQQQQSRFEIGAEAVGLPGSSSATVSSLLPSSSVGGEENDNDGDVEQAERDKAEDWESEESEDDLQIVLNTTSEIYPTADEERDDEIGMEEEDERNMAMATAKEAGEGKEWEESPPPSSPGQFGTLSSAAITPTEVANTPGEDKGSGAPKSGTAAGIIAASPRIGYSGQGYHVQPPHHMQFKYVRQAPKPGGLPTSATSTVPGGRGPAGEWNPTPGADRGAPRRAGQPRSSRYPGTDVFINYADFNLPPTKTVFDIDIDTLEEKPWRRPGVDITDFFNYGFDELNWKQYCRRLAKLRLEATMQSKIRVYESTRSEQAYDPDLPPELAAAAGMADAFNDSKSMQERANDGNAGGSGMRHSSEGGQGRGATWLHPMPPTGRAIQVEGGGAERRPSVDVRRQRTRDSDAVIQIMPQDAEEESEVAAPHEEAAVFMEERDTIGGSAAGPESFGPESDMWDRDSSLLGTGPSGTSGHRRELDGSHHLYGGGMMQHPGPGSGYGLLPGEPFGLPPLARSGTGRRPMYGGPRPMPSLGGSRQDPFSLRHPDFNDPLRRGAPPPFAALPPNHLKTQQGHLASMDDPHINGNVTAWGRKGLGVLGGVKEQENSRLLWQSEDYEKPDDEALLPKAWKAGYHESGVDGESPEQWMQEHKRPKPQGFIGEADELAEPDLNDNAQFSKRQKVHDQVDISLKPGREEVSIPSIKKHSPSPDSGRSLEPSNDRYYTREESSGSEPSDSGRRGFSTVEMSKRDGQAQPKKLRLDKKEKTSEPRAADNGRLDARGAHPKQKDERDRKSGTYSHREKHEVNAHSTRRSFESSHRSKLESMPKREGRSEDTKGSLENGEKTSWSQRKDNLHEVSTSAPDRGRAREGGRYGNTRKDDSRGKEGAESDDQQYSRQRNGWGRNSQRDDPVHSRYGSSRRKENRSVQPGSLSTGRESGDHYRGMDSRSSREDKPSRKGDDGGNDFRSSGVDMGEEQNADSRRKRKSDSLHSSGGGKAAGSGADDFAANNARGPSQRRAQEVRKRGINDFQLNSREEKSNEGSSSGKARHQLVSARARKKVVGKTQESSFLGRQASEKRNRDWSSGSLEPVVTKKGPEAAEDTQVEKKQQQERPAAATEERKEQFRRRISDSRKPQGESAHQLQTAEVKQERPARKRRWGSD